MIHIMRICSLFGALFLFSCNSPTSSNEPELKLSYCSIVGSTGIKVDMSGSATSENNSTVVTTGKADGLWSDWEEIGYFYIGTSEFNYTFAGVFKSITGTDALRQGGLMVRGSLQSIAPYAAIRLANGIYDPVARLTGSSAAAAAGSTVQYQEGDLLFITCTEQAPSGTTRNITMEVGAKRGDQVLISKIYTVSTTSDTLYAGVFCADHSTSNGSFSVSDLTMK
jgi:hypothetical protein